MLFIKLIIVLILAQTTIAALPESQNDDDKVEISSKHMNYESKTIIVREGKRLMVSCVFNGDDIADISDLQWKKENGQSIDEQSSPSVFTVGVREHHTGHKKKNLHVTSIHKRDEGVYICEGRNLDGIMYTDKVQITVLGQIAWNDQAERVGALEGDPLTVDCGVRATSEKEPQIQITNGEGETLDENLYTIVGNEVTIEQLDKNYNGKKISCVHVEMVSNEDVDYPIVDRKDVQIEVWHAPQFEEDENEQYTVLTDREGPVTVVLQCNVTSSNPPATYFAFFRGSTELDDSSKYELTKLVGNKQGAELKIKDVSPEDLTEYRCQVSNGKASAEQIIHLKEANPPPQPKVSLEEIGKHSLTWKIESDEQDGGLPVLSVSIEYIRQSLIQDKELEEEDILLQDDTWKKYGSTVVKHIRRDNLYEITGLRQGTSYMFKFRLRSEAGSGDSILLTASTGDSNEFFVESSAFSTNNLFSFVALFIGYFFRF